MQVKVVTDEHISVRIIKSLRESGLDVFSVFESARGISDSKILNICVKQASVLITSDKNFAAWAVASRPQNFGLILLRFERKDLNKIIDVLKSLFKKPDSLIGTYCVISPNKIRQKVI